MAALTPADRVIALLEWGDVAEADAAIEAEDGWQPVLWRGTRALMEGRFSTCERLAARVIEEVVEPSAALLGTLLMVALRREQQRPAEAEMLVRALLDRTPSAPAGAHALLAALIGEMGRDTQARQELARLLPSEPSPVTGRLGALFQLGELAAALDAHQEAELLYRRLLPHARDFAVEEGGAACYGSASHVLGRLAQTVGDWDQAVAHFEDAVEAHTRAGVPVLLAHTERHLAALLRTRGEDSDWERAVELLDSAAAIYRQVGIDALAADTAAVLARARDGLIGAPRLAGEEAVFRRQGDGWMVGRATDAVRLRDAVGLRDVARLLAAPRAAVHVADLLVDVDDGAGVPSDRPWTPGARRPWLITDPVLDDGTRAECEGRLAELAGELVEAERQGDAVRAALARAERDSLIATLSEGEAGDPLERARSVVGTRIRITLNHIEQAEPELGHHLRSSIRTGTFCSYEPDHPIRWTL